MEQEMILTHKFTEAGLGQAPFRFTGISENLFKMADGSCKPGGSCDFCFTGIRYEHHIVSADGQKSKVGSECIQRVADAKLVQASKLAKKKLERERKLQKQREAWEVELTAQRERNGGLTNAELNQQIREMNQKLSEEKALADGEQWAEEAGRLHDGKGGFRDSISNDLRRGRLPQGNGLNIALDILAKQKGRRNSQEFQKEFERLEQKFSQQ